MPQVPNRYFNNQVLQDVGRNLSLAIGGDPEREAARDRQNYEMQRMRDADAFTASERVREQNLSDVLGQLAAASPELKAGLAQQAIGQYRGNPDTVFKAWGKGSPTYQAQEGLIDERFEGTLAGIEKRLTAAEVKSQRDDATRQRGQDMTADSKRLDRELRVKLAQLGAETRLAIRGMKGKDGTPLDISPEDRQNIQNQVLLLADDMQGQLDPALVRRIVTRTSELYQESRNSSSAFDQAVAEVLNNPQIIPGEKPWYKPFSDAPPSTIVPGVPAASSAPAAAPAGPLNLSSPLMGGTSLGASLFMQPPTDSPAIRQFGSGAAPKQFSPRSPAAEQALKAAPTPEMKAFFEDKYGYLPPGL